MSIYINGHALDITTGTNGVRLAECKCGAKIHTQLPNRKHQNITLEEFMHEANVIHQQHLHNIVERERLKALLNTKYGKNAKYPETDIMIETPTTYQETDSMSEIIKPCKLNYSNQDEHRLQGGAHNYTSHNPTFIYCTQCGDVQLIGGVVENVNMDNHKDDLSAELNFWKSWYVSGKTRDKIDEYIKGVLAHYVDKPMSAPNINNQSHAILESIHGFMREDINNG